MNLNLNLMQVKKDDYTHYYVLAARTTKKSHAKDWQCESISAELVFVQFIFIYKVVNKNMNHLLLAGCYMTSPVTILLMLVTGVGQLVWILLFLHTLFFTVSVYIFQKLKFKNFFS